VDDYKTAAAGFGSALASDCEAAGIVLNRHPRLDAAEGLDRLRAAMQAGSHPRVYWRNAISRSGRKSRCYPSLAESSAAVADTSLDPWNNTKVTTEWCNGGTGCDLGREQP
jgi:hypothetical protein